MEQLDAIPSPVPARPKLSVSLAHGEAAILEAQRLPLPGLRRRTGCRLPTQTPGVDHDLYDPYCRHLVVRDDDSGETVGTYRILTPDSAERVGYHAESEFDLTRLRHLRPRLVEIGRSCVHRDYRTGATITLLWLVWPASCGKTVTTISSAAPHKHGRRRPSGGQPVPIGLPAAKPHPGRRNTGFFPVACLWPPCSATSGRNTALIRAYLRAGAWICGEPAWDPDFNTADLPILLPMARLDNRYAKHFLGQSD